AHVGDEPNAALASQLDPLVQVLRQAHRALRSEPELLRPFLLERRRRERGGGVLSALALLDVSDGEEADTVRRLTERVRDAPDLIHDALRVLALADLRLL